MTMKRITLRKLSIVLAVIIIAVVAFSGGAVADRLITKSNSLPGLPGSTDLTLVREESAVIEATERVSPSVVTVSVQTQRRRVLDFDMFEGFRSRIEGGTPQDIGTGFIVTADGLIVTNKHVVSDTAASYKVITNDNKEYNVEEINRDPSNDIAILKINASGLSPVTLGDSNNLKVGQFVIAIGTALGEFRHTVTTGVISGLGRGITAGSPYEGFVEQLDNVIQTDAAINPGNSGGPLLNSAGQVIGVNVAVAQGAQNIGFAIPIEVVKKGLEQFQSVGHFEERPYLGVTHRIITERVAILNELPQGAYIEEIIAGSPAEKAGLLEGDIITNIEGTKISEQGKGLADIIATKKVGDQVRLNVWRDGETKEIIATLEAFPEQ